jgi:hypothetical protein
VKARTIVGLVFITIGLALTFLSPLLFDTHEQTPVVVPIEPNSPEEATGVDDPKKSSTLPLGPSGNEKDPPKKKL